MLVVDVTIFMKMSVVLFSMSYLTSYVALLFVHSLLLLESVFFRLGKHCCCNPSLQIEHALMLFIRSGLSHHLALCTQQYPALLTSSRDWDTLRYSVQLQLQSNFRRHETHPRGSKHSSREKAPACFSIRYLLGWHRSLYRLSLGISLETSIAVGGLS